MGLMDLFRRKDDGAAIPNQAEIVARYTRLRNVACKLSQKLVERLSRDVMHEGGRKLGILQKGALVFDTLDETSVLMDYCIYDVRRNGRNAFEQYLIDCPPEPDSDEMACLKAMQHSRYSLLVVESVMPGFGVAVHDAFTDESLVITDMAFSKSGRPGLLLATRVLFHEDFAMTGGAALPIGMLSDERRRAELAQLARMISRDAEGRFDPAHLIRECLRLGASSRIHYAEPPSEPLRGPQSGRRPAIELASPARSGRNGPCPCGSGRKAKNCCG